MILKEADDRVEDIEELKRLKAVVPASFRTTIQKQIDNIYAGIAGEQDAAHFLGREFGHSREVMILHDLRLGLEGDFAQIDHLVIHRVQATAWVLETKNYAGRLSCDDHGDWTVWRNGKPTPIPSPSNQARRHCQTLQLWLEAHGINIIQKIEPVVLISPFSSVNRKELSEGTHVVKSDNFGAWWRKQTDAISLRRAFRMAGRHLLSGMSPEEFMSFGKRLAAAHVPATFDWRTRLRLPGASGLANSACESPTAALGKAARSEPQIIATLHGKVTITRLPDGLYALRNDKNDSLIEIVKEACRGRGHWNPRFRNWLIAEDKLESVLASLTE